MIGRLHNVTKVFRNVATIVLYSVSILKHEVEWGSRVDSIFRYMGWRGIKLFHFYGRRGILLLTRCNFSFAKMCFASLKCILVLVLVNYYVQGIQFTD